MHSEGGWLTGKRYDTTAMPMSRSHRSRPLGTEVLTPGKTGCAGTLEVRYPAIRNSGFDSRPAQSDRLFLRRRCHRHEVSVCFTGSGSGVTPRPTLEGV